MIKYSMHLIIICIGSLWLTGCAATDSVPSPTVQAGVAALVATSTAQHTSQEAVMTPNIALPELLPINVTNAKNLRLIKTFAIPGFSTSQVSQCSVDFNPDGGLLAGVCYKNTAPIWETQSGRLRFELLKAPEHMVAVRFSPDGKTLAIGGFSGKIALYDANSGVLVRELLVLPSAVWELDFSPAGDRLVSASINSGVRLWDTISGKAIWDYGAMEQQRVLSLAYAPDGKTIACGLLEGGVVVLDARTGEVIHRLPVEEHVGDVAYSPDGSLLASGSDDKLIRLWKTADYSLLKSFVGHTDFVNGIAFSPGGGWLVSGSHDRTVAVWDTGNGQQLTQLKGHEGVVLRVVVNTDGTLIASISWDGTVRLWGVVNSG